MKKKSTLRKDMAHTGVQGRLLRPAKIKRRYGVFAEARSTFTRNGHKVLYTL